MTVDVRQASVQPLRLSAPAWLGNDQLQLQSLRRRRLLPGGRRPLAVQTCRGGMRRRSVHDGRPVCLEARDRGPVCGGNCCRARRRPICKSMAASTWRDWPRLLPDTLRIREGATIEAGRVQIHCAGQQSAQQRGWQAAVETSELAAVAMGAASPGTTRSAPSWSSQQREQGWNVRQLACHASFLELTGQGTPQAGSVDLTCDLARLVSELHQLFDLGALQAAGTLHTQLDWQRSDDGRVAVERDEHDRESGVGRRRRIAAGGNLACRPRCRWRPRRRDSTQLTSMRTGRFELSSAADRLDLQLLEPVANPGRDAVWSVGGMVRGDVAHWLAQCAPFLPGVLRRMAAVPCSWSSRRASRHRRGCQATGISLRAAAIQFVRASTSTNRPCMWNSPAAGTSPSAAREHSQRAASIVGVGAACDGCGVEPGGARSRG